MEEIKYNKNSINDYMDDGNTILTRAIIDNQNDMLSDLIEGGADIELREKNFGMTPFLIAVHYDNVKAMEILHKSGADTEAKSYVNYADKYIYEIWCVSQVSKDIGQSALNANVENWCALQVAVANESTGALEYLLDKTEFEIDKPMTFSSNDETILMFASWKNKIESIKLLLKKGASIKKRSGSGDTILHIALGSSSIEVAEELLSDDNKELFDITEIIEKKNLINVSSLMIAAEKGFSKIVKLMLDRGASLNCRNLSGRTPLMSAAFNGHLDVVNVLIEEGAEIDARDFTDNTALLCAADMTFGKGNKEVVKYLLDKGANANAYNNQNHTALMWAAKKGHPDIVHMLLQKGSDPAIRTTQGWTARKYAVEWDNNEVVEVIDAMVNNEPEIQIRARLNGDDEWAHLQHDSAFYFGETSTDSERRAEFLICNYGGNDLVITNINVEDKDVVEVDATESSSIIKPGTTTPFFVTFDIDSKKPGEYSTKITISSNDPNESKFAIIIRGIWK